jgi:hypothetical protein
MMRGTIWTMVDDVPIRRQVLTLRDATTPEEFKFQATYRAGQIHQAPLDLPDGGWLEFGPIAQPWTSRGV